MGWLNHDEGEEYTVLHLLSGFYRQSFAAMKGERGPTVAKVSRVVGVALVLICAGPILWQALLHVPLVLILVALAAVATRVAMWAWRRGSPR